MKTFPKSALALSLLMLCACASVQDSGSFPSSSEGTTESSSSGGASESSSSASITTGTNVNDAFAAEDRIDITGDFASQSAEDLPSEAISFDVSELGDGKAYKITASGTYIMTGSNANAKITIDAAGCDVTLILNGINLTCTSESPIKLKAANSFTLHVASATKNYLVDGESNEDDGTLVCKKDTAKLNIEGSGYLYVTSNRATNDEGDAGIGIKSPMGISIKDTHLIVSSTDHALSGKAGVSIEDAKLYLDAKGDGIHSDGEVSIKNSVLDSSTYGDGIDAAGAISLENVTSHITTTGVYKLYSKADDTDGTLKEDARYILVNGEYKKIDSDSANRYSSLYYLEQKCKGVKSEAALTFKGGDHYLKTADDCIASDTEISLLSGDYSLYTGDQALNSDQLLNVGESGSSSDLDVRIYHCYEGIQGGQIHFYSGYTYICAEDDGINATSDTDGYSVSMNFHEGATVYANAEGDGVDSNGNITMDGGNLIVAGPSSGGNGSLDFDGTFTFTGGNLLAVGSNSMAQVPNTSKVNALSYGTSSWSKGSVYSLYCGDKEFSIVLPKNLQSVSFIVQSPSLTTGSSLSVVKGASIGADTRNGVYFGEKNSSGGTTLIEGTVSNGLTKIGTTSNHPGGGPGGR